jgi:hypothetical protein
LRPGLRPQPIVRSRYAASATPLPKLLTFEPDINMYDVPLSRDCLFGAVGASSILVMLRLVDTVNSKLLLEISEMPNLQNLIIVLCVQGTLVLDTASRSSLPALVKLEVMAMGNTPDMTRILASIASPHFRSLHILLRGNIDAHSFTVATKAPPLTCFGLAGRSESHTAIPGFEPLFSLATSWSASKFQAQIQLRMQAAKISPRWPDPGHFCRF